MFSSPYFQHALYSIACLSISINLVGMRRAAEDDKARLEAKFSILQTIKEHLTNDDSPPNREELERLMRLAKRSAIGDTEVVREESHVSWSDIFAGKTPKIVVGEELSRWEKEDLEKLRKELDK